MMRHFSSPRPLFPGLARPKRGLDGAVRLGLLLALARAPLPGHAQASVVAPRDASVGDSVVTRPVVVRHNVLKASPLTVIGALSAFYERSVTERVAVVVGYGAGGTAGIFGSGLQQGEHAYRRGTVEVRRYWKKGLWGFYAGAYVRLTTLRESYSYYLPPGPPGPVGWREQHARLWTPGVMLGHQWLTRWFALDTFLGLQQTRGGGAWVPSNMYPEAMASSVITGRLGLSIGVPF